MYIHHTPLQGIGGLLRGRTERQVEGSESWTAGERGSARPYATARPSAIPSAHPATPAASDPIAYPLATSQFPRIASSTTSSENVEKVV